MIKKILTCYAERLEEFLRTDFPQPEGLVEVGFVGNGSEGKKNKLLVTPFGGDWFPRRAQSNKYIINPLINQKNENRKN